ncbi:alcohol dehydrogenase [Penicillium taxi]|uniref:alcohol dehydrogenase n=1 Tax=Penicillium taxi TaxID=168475 RepID=UPI0025452865|nr:alcohol dehydrogenase [Penicillium taxi]KAJ5907618.1 alcohol dehydrogenase [Penicillium taxi]
MLTDVAGHEGVGKVIGVGPNVDEQQWIGQRVGVRWLYSSCLECEICAVNHTACPKQKNAGANVPGTFQQYIVSPAIHATMIPQGLSPDVAAPLLCAGIAMYSSIQKTKTRPGDWIAILGAGGGLGHMGIQIAAKKGIRVLAIDNERSYEQSMQMLRPLGTLVCVGIPNTPFKLPASPFDMIVKGHTIVGNSAGTAKEMEELIEMAVAGDVEAHVQVFEFDEIAQVLRRLEQASIEGRAVLRIPE